MSSSVFEWQYRGHRMLQLEKDEHGNYHGFASGPCGTASAIAETAPAALVELQISIDDLIEFAHESQHEK